jgi:flagella basal body P-ring formation protein FlgA
LEPSDEEYRKWREQLIFLQNVKRGEKLTDAEVKKAEGLYEYLKNSKFEVPSSVTNNTIFK